MRHNFKYLIVAQEVKCASDISVKYTEVVFICILTKLAFKLLLDVHKLIVFVVTNVFISRSPIKIIQKNDFKSVC